MACFGVPFLGVPNLDSWFDPFSVWWFPFNPLKGTGVPEFSLFAGFKHHLFGPWKVSIPWG